MHLSSKYRWNRWKWINFSFFLYFVAVWLRIWIAIYAHITERGWALTKQMHLTASQCTEIPNQRDSVVLEKRFLSYLETLFLFEEILTILSLQNRRIKAFFYFRQGLQKVKDLCQVCRRHVSCFHSHSFSHHKRCIFMNCLLVQIYNRMLSLVS